MARTKVKVSVILAGMEVGSVREFPIAKIKSVRVEASYQGMIHNRKYETKADKDRRVVIVTRTE